MNRNQAKKFYPIFQAFAEGRPIECRTRTWSLNEGWECSTNWEKAEELNFQDTYEYRIKPGPKYRPFKDTKECWQEMQKHQPFGWLKDKNKDSELRNIQALTEEMPTMTDRVYLRGIRLIDGWHIFEGAIEEYTFADGTPFGILEDF